MVANVDFAERETAFNLNSHDARRTDRRKLGSCLCAWLAHRANRQLDPAWQAAARESKFVLSRQSVLVPLLNHRERARIRNAQSTDVPSAGGFAVAEEFAERLEVALDSINSIRRFATVIRTDKGGPLTWPFLDDTSISGEIHRENVISTEADATFGARTFGAYSFSSKSIRVSAELAEDAPLLLANLPTIIGRRIARIQNEKWINGTGAGEPYGLRLASALGVTAASASAVTYDELLALIHSVDAEYRERETCGFIMHNDVLLLLKKLKDSAGAPIVRTGWPGKFDLIDRYPVFVNKAMPSSLTTGSRAILFGDVSQYAIRDVNALKLRADTETYAETDEILFSGILRSDGNLLNANAVKHLKMG